MLSFKGTFFLTTAELSASVFGTCAELWVLIAGKCKIIGTFRKSVGKIAKKANGVQKLLDDFVAF